ncbi:hypothetical protein MHYP_G00155500 [Metynnis hypsauchen]
MRSADGQRLTSAPRTAQRAPSSGFGWNTNYLETSKPEQKEHPAPYDEEHYKVVDGLSKAIHRTRALSW